MDIIPVFRGSSGLNTKVDPVRVRYDSETGVSDLTKAVNITHDDSGRPQRRPGQTLLQLGSYHSLFCDQYDCFVGSGKNLYKVNTDWSLTGVRGNLYGSRISFCQVGPETYYANGFENGVIIEGKSYDWPIHQYEGPETTRQFTGAPIGVRVGFFINRWFVVVGNTIYFSEPWASGLFDAHRNHLVFTSNVRMVKPVEKGIYVSDEKNIWFFKGQEPSEFTQELVASYPALEWSEAIDLIKGTEIGLEQPGLCALWGTTKGAMLGTADGQVINLTDKKVAYPVLGSRGASLLRDKHFIHSMFF